MFTGQQLFGQSPKPNLNTASQLLPETASASVKASLALDPLTAGNLDTVIEAHTAGTDGNSITIEFVHSAGAPNAGTLTRVGTAFTFTFKGGTTTVGNFETAVAALAGADELIEVKTPGTGSDVLSATDDLLSPTALAGGLTLNTLAAKFPVARQIGAYSVHTIIGSGGTGSVKFYFSNLPCPSTSDLTHWVEDSTKAITLSGSAASTLTTGVDKCAEHGLCVVALTAGTASVVAWAAGGSI